MRERVTERIVSSAEGFLVAHQVDNKSGRGYKEDFHRGVVYADEVHEEVDISHAEDDHVNFLCFAREACMKIPCQTNDCEKIDTNPKKHLVNALIELPRVLFGSEGGGLCRIEGVARGFGDLPMQFLVFLIL